MNVRYYIWAIGIFGVGVCSGHYLGPRKILTVTKTVEVEKHQEKDKTDTVSNTHTVTTTKEDKDGGKETVTVSDTGTESKESKSGSGVTTIDGETRTDITTGSSHGTSLYGLAGYRLGDLGQPVYGVGLSQHVLGPVQLGVWGLPMDKTYGLMIGLEF